MPPFKDGSAQSEISPSVKIATSISALWICTWISIYGGGVGIGSYFLCLGHGHGRMMIHYGVYYHHSLRIKTAGRATATASAAREQAAKSVRGAVLEQLDAGKSRG